MKTPTNNKQVAVSFERFIEARNMLNEGGNPEKAAKKLERWAMTPEQLYWLGIARYSMGDLLGAKEAYQDAFAEHEPGYISQVAPILAERDFRVAVRIHAGLSLASILAGEAKKAVIADTLALSMSDDRREGVLGRRYLAVCTALLELAGIGIRPALPKENYGKGVHPDLIHTSKNLYVPIQVSMKPAANLTEYTDNGIIYLHTTDTGIEDVRELNSLALLLEKFLRSPETDMPKPVMISVEHTAAAISEQFVCIKSAA